MGPENFPIHFSGANEFLTRLAVIAFGFSMRPKVLRSESIAISMKVVIHRPTMNCGPQLFPERAPNAIRCSRMFSCVAQEPLAPFLTFEGTGFSI